MVNVTEAEENYCLENVLRIIDPGAAFLELSPLAAFELYDGRAHSSGIVTGIGMVHGVSAFCG